MGDRGELSAAESRPCLLAGEEQGSGRRKRVAGAWRGRRFQLRPLVRLLQCSVATRLDKDAPAPFQAVQSPAGPR